MQFEDTTLPALKEYDEYLSYMYGDYMTIPSKEDRVTHEFKEIDFGPYDNILDIWYREKSYEKEVDYLLEKSLEEKH